MNSLVPAFCKMGAITIVLFGLIPLSLAQSIPPPPVLKWDSTVLLSAPHLVQTPSGTKLFALERGIGQFFADLTDSLTLENKSYVNPGGVGAYEIDHRFGKFYLGGTVAGSGPQLRKMGMARISGDFFTDFSVSGVNEAKFLFGTAMSATSDSGGIVAGTYFDFISRDALVHKIDGFGILEWEEDYAVASLTQPYSVAETKHGTFWVGGYASGSIDSIPTGFLLKLGPSGDSIDCFFYRNNTATITKVFENAGSDLILIGEDAGQLAPLSSPTFSQLFFIKTDSSGIIKKETIHSGYLGVSSKTILRYENAIMTSDQGVLIAGTVTLRDSGMSDRRKPYLLKLDSSGEYQWHHLLSPPNANNTSAIAVAQTNDGHYVLISSEEPLNGIAYLVFTLLGPDGTFTSVEDESFTSSLRLHPNPVSDYVTVSWQQSTSRPTQISILDLAGREMLREERLIQGGKASEEIDLSSLAAGTYVVQVRSGELVQSVKLIKQKK